MSSRGLPSTTGISAMAPIDQPGNQDPATTVDNLVTVGWEALRNLANAIVFHNDVSSCLQCF
jgi:hypothetical protein